MENNNRIAIIRLKYFPGQPKPVKLQPLNQIPQEIEESHIETNKNL